jgi:hypothetical protein
MLLEKASPASPGMPQDKLPGVVNYLKGQNQKDWRVDIPTYERVVYRAIYSGVDIVYYGNNRQVEYDLVIAPGADPSQIGISIAGADKCKLDASGDLQIVTRAGILKMHRPVAYQTIDGSRRPVAASYHLRGNILSFHLAKYDRTRPLTIDPTISYSTLLGGNGATSAAAIAVDSAGNAYIAGYTSATNFPTTAGVFRTTAAGAADGFITKLNATGTVVFSTYVGGSQDDYINGIAVDGSENVYVTGYTFSGNFPTVVPSGPKATNIATAPDAFVLKLTPGGQGGAGWYSTILGSTFTGTPVFTSGSDIGYAIAVDSSGQAYVTGQTSSPTLCTTTGVCQSGMSGANDAFLVRVKPDGNTDIARFLGGSGADQGLAIAVNATGSAIYVAGSSTSTAFPGITAVRANAGGTDAFVAALNNTGSLTGFTFYGASGDDYARAIALSGTNIYIGGETSPGTPALPNTTGKIQTTYRGGASDGFLAQLNSSLAVNYSTYLGGSGTDAVNGIAVDGSGNVILAGNTNSDNFPTSSPLPSGRGGLMDAFVTKLNSAATTYMYSTFLGGVSDDFAQAVGTNGSDAFVVGHTFSADFPDTSGSAIARPAGFVTRIKDGGTSPRPVASDFNKDGHPDLVWQNDITRQVGVWYMSGAQNTTQIGYSYPAPGQYPGWTLVTVADMDRNGTPDLIWQNDATRAVGTWYMGGPDGTTVLGVAYQAGDNYPDWHVVSVHDMNGDGVPDLVWQNDTTRQVGTWFMSGPLATTVIGVAYQAPGSYPGWTLVGVADMDGNGVPDLVWQNDDTRSVGTWYMSGPQATIPIGSAYQAPPNLYRGWKVVAVQDMDANGIPDLVWQNETTRYVGTWYLGGPQATDVLGSAYQTTTTYPNWRALGAK